MRQPGVSRGVVWGKRQYRSSVEQSRLERSGAFTNTYCHVVACAGRIGATADG
jgi:hypothetical protein